MWTYSNETDIPFPTRNGQEGSLVKFVWRKQSRTERRYAVAGAVIGFVWFSIEQPMRTMWQ
jgi:hypothetical protein